jgi:hypothetical protein
VFNSTHHRTAPPTLRRVLLHPKLATGEHWYSPFFTVHFERSHVLILPTVGRGKVSQGETSQRFGFQVTGSKAHTLHCTSFYFVVYRMENSSTLSEAVGAASPEMEESSGLLQVNTGLLLRVLRV